MVQQNPVFNYRRALSANCSVSALESSLRKDDGLDWICVRSQTQRPHTRTHRRTVKKSGQLCKCSSHFVVYFCQDAVAVVHYSSAALHEKTEKALCESVS